MAMQALLLWVTCGQGAAAPPLRFELHRRELPSSPSIRRRRRLSLTTTSFSSEHNTWGTIAVEGYMYSYLRVGAPMQKFAVILDTGSAITSIPCKGCSACGTHMDPAFDAALSSTAKDTGKVFSQSYLEGSSLRGTFVEDEVCLGDDCTEVEQVRFTFGCATTMTNMFRTQKADGIIGLDMSPRSLLHELATLHKLDADVFSLCFGRQGGFLSVGGISDVHHVQPMGWSPFVQRGQHYQLSLNSFTVVGHGAAGTIAIPKARRTAMIDTGSTFSYVTPDIWKPLSAAWHAWCNAPSPTGAARCVGTPSSHDATSIACFAASSAKASSFPTVRLALDGETTLCIPPEQLMFVEEGHLCVGLLNDPRLVIGANLMLDYDVVFDRSEKRVGFARSMCGRDAKPFCCGGECASGAAPAPAQGLRGAKTASVGAPVAAELPPAAPAGLNAPPTPAADAPSASPATDSSMLSSIETALESLASLLTSTGSSAAGGGTPDVTSSAPLH